MDKGESAKAKRAGCVKLDGAGMLPPLYETFGECFIMISLYQFIKDNYKDNKENGSLLVKMFNAGNVIARFPLCAFYDNASIQRMCTKYKVCTFDGVQGNVIYLQGLD